MLESLSNEVTGLSPVTLLKRDTDVFLWILQNFEEQLFYRTSLVGASEVIPTQWPTFSLFDLDFVRCLGSASSLEQTVQINYEVYMLTLFFSWL